MKLEIKQPILRSYDRTS